jgi:curved DNA-binding protein CbpA
MNFKDYYDILGVDRSVTQIEIKRAYRKLARKYHPDVSDVEDAEARFKEVGEAYEVLKDPEKRAAYDQLGETGRQVNSLSRRRTGMRVLNLVAVGLPRVMLPLMVTFLNLCLDVGSAMLALRVDSRDTTLTEKTTMRRY